MLTKSSEYRHGIRTEYGNTGTKTFKTILIYNKITLAKKYSFFKSNITLKKQIP